MGTLIWHITSMVGKNFRVTLLRNIVEQEQKSENNKPRILSFYEELPAQE